MVLPAGITKDSGLTAVLTEMNLSAHNTIAVGDAENDLSLFAVAEIGVAVVEPSRRFANTPISCSTPLPDIRAPSIVNTSVPSCPLRRLGDPIFDALDESARDVSGHVDALLAAHQRPPKSTSLPVGAVGHPLGPHEETNRGLDTSPVVGGAAIAARDRYRVRIGEPFEPAGNFNAGLLFWPARQRS